MVSTFSISYKATHDPPVTESMDATSISAIVLVLCYLITVDNDPSCVEGSDAASESPPWLESGVLQQCP